LFLYQSTLHVPLIVRPPGGAARPARVRAPVGLVDVTPTILAAVGAGADAALEGRALPGAPGEAAGGAGAAGMTAEGYYCENLMPHFSYGWAGLRGYRDGSRKLIHGARLELYDLQGDPR